MMEQLFKKWEERTSKKSDKSTNNKDNTQTEEIDKNSKMLLRSILFTHKKYMKETIPSEYIYDESTRDFKQVDVTKEITPFTTNKKSMFQILDKEREAYLSKSVNKD
jgi:hypothetical protein